MRTDSVISSSSLLAGKPDLASASIDDADKVGGFELNRRYVDRHRYVIRPLDGVCTGSPNTHSPIGTISPVSSAIEMNSSGGTKPRSG